jgi:hypothetical protein
MPRLDWLKHRVVCLDDVSRRTLGLCAFAYNVSFTGVRPAVLATENVARRAYAFARICTRGNNSPLQSLLRAERRK